MSAAPLQVGTLTGKDTDGTIMDEVQVAGLTTIDTVEGMALNHLLNQIDLVSARSFIVPQILGTTKTSRGTYCKQIIFVLFA